MGKCPGPLSNANDAERAYVPQIEAATLLNEWEENDQSRNRLAMVR
jgi:hypothetical protein